MTQQATTNEINRLRQEADGMTPALRSCWVCNPAHEHLKQVDYLILCFECEHYFYKGQDITCAPTDQKPLHWIGLTPAANEIADRVAVFLHNETQNVDHKTVQMTDVLTGFLGPILKFIDLPWDRPTSLAVLEGVIRIVISDVPNWRFPDDDDTAKSS